MQQNEFLYVSKNKKEFSNKDITEMYKLFHIDGIPALIIAAKFNVGKETLSLICSNKLYVNKIHPDIYNHVKENGSINNKSTLKRK